MIFRRQSRKPCMMPFGVSEHWKSMESGLMQFASTRKIRQSVLDVWFMKEYTRKLEESLLGSVWIQRTAQMRLAFWARGFWGIKKCTRLFLWPTILEKSLHHLRSRRWIFRQTYQDYKHISLIEGMRKSQAAQSTTPRDKICVLLGLTYDGDDLVPYPDYK